MRLSVMRRIIPLLDQARRRALAVMPQKLRGHRDVEAWRLWRQQGQRSGAYKLSRAPPWAVRPQMRRSPGSSPFCAVPPPHI